MSEVGRIQDIYIPTDRATGRPRGFAFVEYTDPEAAATAIEKFNEHELAGRKLRINLAEERRPRAPRPSPGGGGGYQGESNFRNEDAWGPKPSKPKGSRRNIRGRKRSL